MFRIGAHVSISGGFDRAVEREVELGGNCGQLFVGSPRRWTVGEVTRDDAAAFREALEGTDVEPWIVHGTYLVNFATPKDDLGERSVETVQSELEATATLDVPYYVFHPGSHTGAGRERGVENVADRLSELDVPDGTTLLLENTAGEGTATATSASVSTPATSTRPGTTSRPRRGWTRRWPNSTRPSASRTYTTST